jgi:hypothetical protein
MGGVGGGAKFPDASSSDGVADNIEPGGLQGLEVAPHAPLVQRAESKFGDEVVAELIQCLAESGPFEDLEEAVLSNELFVSRHETALRELEETRGRRTVWGGSRNDAEDWGELLVPQRIVSRGPRAGTGDFLFS